MSAVQSQARVSVLFLLLTIILAFLPNSRRSRGLNHNSRPTVLGANPVTSDGSNYRTDVTEDEAFLWFDEALVHVRAGSGGQGANTFKYGGRKQHASPNGGSGGLGGSVVFTLDRSCNTLLGFRGKGGARAENGKDGNLEFNNGLGGTDTCVAVPRGTLVSINETGEVLGELSEEQPRLVVAKGGLGGVGNAIGRVKGEKSKCTPPQGGEKRWLKLELRLVADIGLVGYPNAGKSTLLKAMTNASPKIASYPFTTIVPNLGVCEVGAGRSGGDGAMVIADIPGLIEGAHRGVGLGRGFLRHVERCKIIIHIVSGTSLDPLKDFTSINQELALFSPLLAQKPQIVVLNKIDEQAVEESMEQVLALLRENMPHTRLLPISAAGLQGVEDLKLRTYKFLMKVKETERGEEEEEREKLRKQEEEKESELEQREKENKRRRGGAGGGINVKEEEDLVEEM